MVIEMMTKKQFTEFLTKDFWSYCKKYFDPDYENQDYWKGLIDDARDIDTKYGGDDLAQKLLLAIINYHDDRNHNGKTA
jgi:hypothetical protein